MGVGPGEWGLETSEGGGREAAPEVTQTRVVMADRSSTDRREVREQSARPVLGC